MYVFAGLSTEVIADDLALYVFEFFLGSSLLPCIGWPLLHIVYSTERLRAHDSEFFEGPGISRVLVYQSFHRVIAHNARSI